MADSKNNTTSNIDVDVSASYKCALMAICAILISNGAFFFTTFIIGNSSYTLESPYSIFAAINLITAVFFVFGLNLFGFLRFLFFASFGFFAYFQYSVADEFSLSWLLMLIFTPLLTIRLPFILTILLAIISFAVSIWANIQMFVI